MIKLKNRTNCCGCGACEQSCPKGCIQLKEDGEGFLYPYINNETCINCGICENVCPILVAKSKFNKKCSPDTIAFAAYNNNEEIRMTSSSGGVFTSLAEEVLRLGGVVFGAKFDEEWNVVHTYIEKVSDLDLLRRSKYVQSRMGSSYQDARNFLKNGRLVLFVGTPCQIAGLKSFLRKEYDNLIAVDVICHGVPSPMIWRKYLKEEKEKNAQKAVDDKSTILHSLKDTPSIEGVNFREKSDGWQKFRFVLTLSESKCEGKQSRVLSSPIRQNVYMNLFLNDYCTRPSCYDCKFRAGKSNSDITLADYWGVEKVLKDSRFLDDKGVSLILLHNNSKAMYLNNTIITQKVTLDEGIIGNPAFKWNWPKTWGREYFFYLQGKYNLERSYNKALAFNRRTRILQKVINKVIKIYRLWQRLV